MTATDQKYDYLSDTPLDKRIRYNYAPNHGQAFLDAWRLQRERFAKQLPAPIKHQITDAKSLPDLGKHIHTQDLLDVLLTHFSKTNSPLPLAQAWLKLLVGKFETTGKLHEAYTPKFLAADKSRCRDINLYVTFCEILIAAQKDQVTLLYFNALLKALDTICSLQSELDDTVTSRIAYLIEMEKHLAERLQLDLAQLA